MMVKIANTLIRENEIMHTPPDTILVFRLSHITIYNHIRVVLCAL